MIKKLLFPTLLLSLACMAIGDTPIDRWALVNRHNPTVTEIDPLSPLSVGNGSFAFTVDVTGLQTFTETYSKTGIPLSTQSEWSWHSFPNTEGYKIEDTMEMFDSNGRDVPYPTLQGSDAGQWLRGNPHRFGLGNIGFQLIKEDGSVGTAEDISDVEQTLDMWNGLITSHFTFDGHPITVWTACHPDLDAIAVQVRSPLVTTGQLKVAFRFGYGTSQWGIQPEDWSKPESHSTELIERSDSSIQLLRTLDTTKYSVGINWSGDVLFEETGKHNYALSSTEDQINFTALFSQDSITSEQLESTWETPARSRSHWHDFWQSGAAVELFESSDPRAYELERRIVLSQYLTAIQCGGRLPPQETGLTFNSWYGKPHLEMHWWHGVHFALWDRMETLEATLPWYQEILPKAQEIANNQGYPGARWPKNVDENGNQVPSGIAPLLIWQQPHPIYFAELAYRDHSDQETLDKYSELVFETAAFMAAYPHWNDEENRYNLGPPLIPAQESYDPKTTSNPPFELAYWRWGLSTAQAWRERLGMKREPEWDKILNQLAPYPVYEDLYATAQGMWNTKDHPTHLAIFGMLPGKNVDEARLKRTLVKVLAEWPWGHTWGWDYPMIAMTAARLGEPELALQALMLDVQKNTYLPNGHNFQEPDRLRIYLPGNGGLLTAIAMLAAGWDGAPEGLHAPGFPHDGTWTVKWEGLKKIP